MKLWEKGTTVEDWVTRFTVGDDWRWDNYLLPYDIEGTRQHARALESMGLIRRDELDAISHALDMMTDDVVAGHLTVRIEDEDAHTVIEQGLVDRLGDTGKKIHAGRSRNDQVLIAVRLFLRDHLRVLGREIRSVAARLCDHAARHKQLLMPGYTHMQRAMPSSAGLWAAGYAELLLGDLKQIHAASAAINRSPWGSAAGYGVPYLDMPREAFADGLGFEDLQRNVTSVQLSRGKLELQVTHALVQAGATFNRLASDLVLFNSAEFGFVTLPEAYCTGSSIMPQKRNPDVLELTRASFHRLAAEMHLLTTLPANLPSGYHRDLQLTKEAVMRAVLLSTDIASAMHRVLAGMEFNPSRMQEAVSRDMYATARALERVRAGMPFREAYRKAASELDAIEPPDAEEALAAYSGTGYPGRPDIDSVLNGLDGFADWLGDHEQDGGP